ncbi:universal stress protein [Salinisphaera sp. Q1T1-3]|uniref:universal stress protein n=1 Tax=Salinisphaera sp. Q1T1-3 TaxID=2321229 RepID=UPI000E73F411|nr:universal stress protein [Salinisphaera sp. Q1T1-3]RJS94865.1 universal stress protein [Salinisphaera sp. Q1T1-3]
MYKTILVPFDGSQAALAALELACRLAEPDATLVLLGVPEAMPASDVLGRGTGASPADVDRERLGEEARAGLEAAWATLDEPRGTPEFLVRWGRPAQTIVGEATKRDVDTIVMGNRGLSNIQSMAMGSVSHKVLHTAPCRVITVH